VPEDPFNFDELVSTLELYKQGKLSKKDRKGFESEVAKNADYLHGTPFWSDFNKAKNSPLVPVDRQDMEDPIPENAWSGSGSAPNPLDLAISGTSPRLVDPLTGPMTVDHGVPGTGWGPARWGVIGGSVVLLGAGIYGGIQLFNHPGSGNPPPPQIVFDTPVNGTFRYTGTGSNGKPTDSDERHEVVPKTAGGWTFTIYHDNGTTETFVGDGKLVSKTGDSFKAPVPQDSFSTTCQSPGQWLASLPPPSAVSSEATCLVKSSGSDETDTYKQKGKVGPVHDVKVNGQTKKAVEITTSSELLARLVVKRAFTHRKTSRSLFQINPILML